jgi:xanthine dehydrogenase accessory factor
MSELQDVLRVVEEGVARGEPVALATVVAIRGSTYRREGARYVIPSTGRPVGTISGGCLEGDVHVMAEEVMAEGVPRLAHFDLTADDEAVWGWGLGCNGVIDVFIEPADKAAEIAGAIRRAIDEQRPLAAVTVVEARKDQPTSLGARMLVHPDARAEGTLGDQVLDVRAIEESMRALSEERSGLVELGPGLRAFVEAIIPPPRLLVCGAGHDVIPLVRMAAGIGFRVEVVDDRKAFLKPRRFPDAARLTRAEPIDAARESGVDERTYVVVMSHNFLRDKDYLRSMLGSPVPYLGMLGPAARFERLVAELSREGYEPEQTDLRVVHAPAGLDIGAEGPEEIAWAIIGEIVAVRNGRTGGFLRDRGGPIHDRGSSEAATSGAH